jgi:hypothetical protein
MKMRTEKRNTSYFDVEVNYRDTLVNQAIKLNHQFNDFVQMLGIKRQFQLDSQLKIDELTNGLNKLRSLHARVFAKCNEITNSDDVIDLNSYDRLNSILSETVCKISTYTTDLSELETNKQRIKDDITGLVQGYEAEVAKPC